MNDINKKPYLSPSQLDTFCRCPEQYRRRYIEKHVIPPGVALIRGTSFHKGVEFNFKQKIESKADLPESQILDVMAATFDNEIKTKGVLLTKEEEGEGKKKILGKTKDATIELGSLYRAEGAPATQPLIVEDTQIITIPDASHDLLGRLDLVDTNDCIIDYKTSARKKNRSDADSSIQFTCYALTFRKKFGRNTGGLRMEVYIAKKEPERQILETQRTMDQVERLANRINTMLTALKAGAFPPCAPGAWNCSPKWCGYYETCKVRP